MMRWPPLPSSAQMPRSACSIRRSSAPNGCTSPINGAHAHDVA
jgi:hypothetical protein